MHRYKTWSKTTRLPFGKMKPLHQFILTFVIRSWEMRYFCYGLFRADRINTILLWALLPVSLISFYWISAEGDEAMQWHIYFASQQFYIFMLSLLVWNQFRHSAHAGIATAVLVKSLFSLTSELLGINNHFIWIDVVFQVLIYALILLAIKHYLYRARQDRTH